MFDEKIFIPSDSLTTFNNYDCHLITDKGVILSFNKGITCVNNSCDVPTFKVYQKNHYLVQYEDITISQKQYDNLVSSCNYSNYTDFTSDVFYRFDIDSILVIFFILLLVLFYFPYRVITRMFGRWFKW